MNQTGPLLQYIMDDAKAFPLLSHEKETELFTIMRRSRSDTERKEAREVLINSNIRLAISIAVKYLATRIPIEDLVGAALEGLIRGIDRFDPEMGTKFSTFGMVWIRQSVARALIDSFYNTPFRIPVHIMDDAKRVRRARWLLRKLGKDPTVLQIAQETNINPRRVRRILEMERTGAFASVQSTEGPEDKDTAPTNTHICNGGDKPIKEIMDEERLIGEILSHLEPREAETIIRRFMGDTLAKIAESFRVTRERVRQIQLDATRKIKAEFGERWIGVRL